MIGLVVNYLFLKKILKTFLKSKTNKDFVTLTDMNRQPAEHTYITKKEELG